MHMVSNRRLRVVKAKRISHRAAPTATLMQGNVASRGPVAKKFCVGGDESPLVPSS
jgi:hypothetical protein